MSFAATHLYEVMPYRRGEGRTPKIPDFDSLTLRLQSCQRTYDIEDLKSEIKGIADDFDIDETMGNFIEKADEVIQTLHDTVNSAKARLEDEDFENMSRSDMIAMLEGLREDLDSGSPPLKYMSEMITDSWYIWDVYFALQRDKNLFHLTFWPTSTNDYMSTLNSQERGKLEITSCGNGVLRFINQYDKSYLIITSEGSIYLKGPAEVYSQDNSFVMKVSQFKEYFENWLHPTEEEIALFDITHPGADWSVMRYLRDYEQHSGYYDRLKPSSVAVSLQIKP